MLDLSPNPNTHVYGHKDLINEELFIADMHETHGTDQIIKQQERRFIQRHQRVVKKLRAMERAEEEEQPEDRVLEIPHNMDEWERAAPAATERPRIAGRLSDVIDRLVAAGPPISDSPQRVGQS